MDKEIEQSRPQPSGRYKYRLVAKRSLVLCLLWCCIILAYHIYKGKIYSGVDIPEACFLLGVDENDAFILVPVPIETFDALTQKAIPQNVQPILDHKDIRKFRLQGKFRLASTDFILEASDKNIFQRTGSVAWRFLHWSIFQGSKINPDWDADFFIQFFTEADQRDFLQYSQPVISIVTTPAVIALFLFTVSGLFWWLAVRNNHK